MGNATSGRCPANSNSFQTAGVPAMQRGGARVGSGRKRKPVHDHLRDGTFRPSRHGPRPTNVLTMPVPASAWQPTPVDLVGLGDAGKALVERVLDEYEPSLTDGLQVIEAAHAADTLARLRAEPEPNLRQLRLW